MIGGEKYLIKCSANTTLSIIGTPANKPQRLWLGEKNLVGFNTPYPSQCFYGDYMNEVTDCLEGALPLYRVNPGNTAVAVNTAQKVTNPNEAFWLSTRGEGTAVFSGSLEVSLPNSATDMLVFDARTAPKGIKIRNLSSHMHTTPNCMRILKSILPRMTFTHRSSL